ncbi:MAG: HPF/RaiA family ribosome-associated protein [Patescibacteria group bacterium]
MSFPNISFKHSQTEVNYKLQNIITSKLATLERYIGGKGDNRCEVEFSKVAPHQNGDIYRVEVNIWSDGVLYRAAETASSFENAIDAVRSALDAELKRARTRKMSLWRKGARKMKMMMRFG